MHIHDLQWAEDSHLSLLPHRQNSMKIFKYGHHTVTSSALAVVNQLSIVARFNGSTWVLEHVAHVHFWINCDPSFLTALHLLREN